jgi:glycyl-tRNA synthetase beta chain
VYWFLTLARPGREAAAVIGAALRASLRKLSWPKSMRWGGAGDFTFARPLRRVLCLFDGRVVDVPDLPAGLRTGDMTEGHRFLDPSPVSVRSSADYVSRLRKACVIVDAAERRRLILDGARAAAADAGLLLVEDDGLLDEVTGLVEWPCPLVGRIDAQFMDLPPEVLRTSMRVNQRYFACVRPDSTPAPHFVVIANVPGSDGGKAIIAGNERVLRARFSDARFFWDSDRAKPLETYLPKLAGVTFHAELGSQLDRVKRLGQIAPNILIYLQDGMKDVLASGRPDAAVAAAYLSKADLVTGLVGEFPELQGLIGSSYLRDQIERGKVPQAWVPGLVDRVAASTWQNALDGSSAWREVADAIRDHYAPRGPSEAVPTAPVSVALALADKLDQIVQFFAIGAKPTGSGDPFGLRRAALGVLRILLDNRLSVDLRDLVKAVPSHQGRSKPTEDILAFLRDRFVQQLRLEGRRHDIVAALLARNPDTSFHRVAQRAQSLETFLVSDEGRDLLAGYRRAANIVRKERQRDGGTIAGNANLSKLTHPAEMALIGLNLGASETLDASFEGEQFDGAVRILASYRPAVDRFFQEVTVNADDPDLRASRLALLNGMVIIFEKFADFSKIEG